jgi:hypothetical protein
MNKYLSKVSLKTQLPLLYATAAIGIQSNSIWSGDSYCKKRLITIPSPNEITKNKQSISKGSWARAPPLNAVLIQFQS